VPRLRRWRITEPIQRLKRGNWLQTAGEIGNGRLPGSGLIVEINPLVIPNRDVVLRGRMSRWECPVVFQEIPRVILQICHILDNRGCGKKKLEGRKRRGREISLCASRRICRSKCGRKNRLAPFEMTGVGRDAYVAGDANRELHPVEPAGWRRGREISSRQMRGMGRRSHIRRPTHSQERMRGRIGLLRSK
jgi:hypothetical protein